MENSAGLIELIFSI